MLTRSQKLVIRFGAWALIVQAVLTLFGVLDYQLLFLLDLMGLAIIIELTGPYLIRPLWKSRLNIVLFAGMLVFIIIVLKKSGDMIGISIPWPG
jgi:hypothetical protein